jgi:hypothetical protein
MNVITYRLHIERRCEQRWATRIARDKPFQSPAHAANTFAHGPRITAPQQSTYMPSRLNMRRRFACGSTKLPHQAGCVGSDAILTEKHYANVRNSAPAGL